MGERVSFQAGAQACEGYEAVLASGRGPGVIVIQEWWGLLPHIEDLCDRLAAEGFVALAPDLYHGEKGSNPDEAGRLMMALDIERASRDLGGAVARLLGHPRVSSRKAGVVGFCMGGQLALYAASRHSGIGACVDFYGIHPKVRPDYKAIGCPVLGLFAEDDEFVTPDSARRLGSDLKAAGVRAEIVIYPGAGHAFFNDTRPSAYHRESAQDAWKRLLELFRRELAGEPAAAP